MAHQVEARVSPVRDGLLEIGDQLAAAALPEPTGAVFHLPVGEQPEWQQQPAETESPEAGPCGADVSIDLLWVEVLAVVAGGSAQAVVAEPRLMIEYQIRFHRLGRKRRRRDVLLGD